MANARLGGYLFEVNPHTVSWGYSLNTHSDNTMGGRVVQILGVKVEDITLTGHVLQKRGSQFESLEDFEARIKGMMDRQLETKRPFRFSMPVLGIEGDVFIKSYKTVSYSYKLAAHEYTLVLGVDNGFGSVRSMISDEAVNGLWGATSTGVGLVEGRFRIPSSTSWNTVIQIASMLYNEGALTDSQTFMELLERAEAASNSVGVLPEEEQAAIDWGANIYRNADLAFLGSYDSSGVGISVEGFRQFAVDFLEYKQHTANQYTELLGIVEREDGTYTIQVRAQARSVDTEGVYGTHLDTGEIKNISITPDVWDSLLNTWNLIGYQRGNTVYGSNEYLGIDVTVAEEMLVKTVLVESKQGETVRQRKAGGDDVEYKTEVTWVYTPKFGDGATTIKKAYSSQQYL